MPLMPHSGKENPSGSSTGSKKTIPMAIPDRCFPLIEPTARKCLCFLGPIAALPGIIPDTGETLRRGAGKVRVGTTWVDLFSHWEDDVGGVWVLTF